MDLLRQQTKNSQKQAQSIYKLIYTCTNQSKVPLPFKYLTLAVNIFLNIAVFLGIPVIGILDISFILQSFPLMLTMIILYLVPLVQVYACYQYNIQFFLCAQLELYRNVLGPLLINCLLRDIAVKNQLPVVVNIIIMIFYYLTMSLLLSLFDEDKAKTSIKTKYLTRSFFRFQNQVLLYCIGHSHGQKLLVIGSIVFLISCLYQFIKIYQTKFNQNSFRIKMESISSVFFFFFAIMLMAEALSQQSVKISQNIIISFFILLIYSTLVIFFQKLKSAEYHDVIQLLQIQAKQGNVENIQKYFDVMESIAQNLHVIMSENRFDKIIQNQLTQFWLQHQKHCRNVHCIQQGQIIKLYELINGNQIGILSFKSHMSEVIQRVMKCIYLIDPTNVKILLANLRFYTVCLPSRQNSMELISQIAIFQQNLSFFQKCFYYETKELFQQIVSQELSGQLKCDKQLFQFQSMIHLMTATISQFWLSLLQEKVNLDKLIQLNLKIQPYRENIDKLVRYLIKKDNFSTLKMYEIYCEFCSIIQNNKIKSQIFYNLQDKAKKILSQRKQLQFLSFDSQIGIVAISLSQSSLGQIKMINTQANMIFGYPKDELKGKRVNQIMSSIHSQNHDDILNAFLLNYKKTINTNQRLLFGKNKNGYIFPIYLQLQKTCGDNMKQLTFIANISKYPLKNSFVACMIDQEGQIKQVSAMFKNIFFFSKKNTNDPIGKNIQQIVNDFFCLNNPMEISERVIKVDHKYYGKIDMGIQIQSLAFPKKQLAGYSITFPILTFPDKFRKSSANLSQLSMTKHLNYAHQHNNGIPGYQIHYNHQRNTYQLQKNARHIKSCTSLHNFTLPYINMADMGNVFVANTQVQQIQKPVNQPIRMIRLRNGHFQRAEDAISFYSEQDKETRQKNSLRKNQNFINNKHEELEILFIYYGKIGYFIIFLVLLVFVIIKYLNETNFSIDNQNFMFKIQKKYIVRKYLSQYVATYQLLNLDPTNQYLNDSLQISHENIINAIYDSSILQIQKQNILKVDFLKLEANLTNFFETGLASFDQSLPSGINHILNFSNLIIAMIIAESLLAIFIYFYYVYKLESTFKSLLIIDQKVIRQTIQKCSKLTKSIENSIQSLCQVEGQKNNEANETYSSLNQDQEQQNSNPIKCSKKSISRQKTINLPKLLCFLVPALVFLLYCIFDRLSLQENQKQFKTKANIYKIIYDTAPQSNIILMNTVLQYSYTSVIQLQSSFNTVYQILDNNLKKFQNQYPEYIGEPFSKYYMQNLCTKANLLINKTQCAQIQQGILQHGLSPTLNTFVAKITDLQNSQGNNSISSEKLSILLNLFTLQNQFVLLIIQDISSRVYANILTDSNLYQTQNLTIFYIAIAMLVIKFVYALIYPFEVIKKDLTTSNQLKNIIPEYQNQRRVETFDQQQYGKVGTQLFQQ